MVSTLLNTGCGCCVSKDARASPACSGLQRGAPLRRDQLTGAVRRTLPPQKALQIAAAAATTEEEVEEVEEDIDDLEDGDIPDEEEEAPGAAPQAAGAATTNDLEFALNFLWMDKNIAVAVDQVFSKDQRSPVTEYFFWPRNDAWEELNTALEAKPWISQRDKVILLNRTTQVINYWMTEDGPKPRLEQAEQEFPDCYFKGS